MGPLDTEHTAWRQDLFALHYIGRDLQAFMALYVPKLCFHFKAPISVFLSLLAFNGLRILQ